MGAIENIIKQEIVNYVEQSKICLELALNVVESDDNFNDGQCKKVNELYDKISKIYDEFKNVWFGIQ